MPREREKEGHKCTNGGCRANYMHGWATDTRDENKHRFYRSVFPLSHLCFSSLSHPSDLKHLFVSVTVNFPRVSTVSKVVDPRRKQKYGISPFCFWCQTHFSYHCNFKHTSWTDAHRWFCCFCEWEQHGEMHVENQKKCIVWLCVCVSAQRRPKASSMMCFLKKESCVGRNAN